MAKHRRVPELKQTLRLIWHNSYNSPWHALVMVNHSWFQWFCIQNTHTKTYKFTVILTQTFIGYHNESFPFLLLSNQTYHYINLFPGSKIHGANMGPTWVLSAPDGPMLAPWAFAIRITIVKSIMILAQDRGNSIADAWELPQSSAEPLIYSDQYWDS